MYDGTKERQGSGEELVSAQISGLGADVGQ